MQYEWSRQLLRQGAGGKLFSLLKRERVRRQTYPTREDAKADIFDYIERFYNRQRRHTYLDDVSPVEFENQAMRA